MGNFYLKKIHALILLLFVGVVGINAQTVLISPTGDGGFETGSTFAANGWTATNSANNPWVVGTNGFPSTNSAYISNNSGTSNNYTITTIAHNYFWRDVTVHLVKV